MQIFDPRSIAKPVYEALTELSKNSKQSPLWLKGYEPSIATNPDTFVGFAEYLRWMRSPDKAEKDKTKLEILQLAAEKSKSYRTHLRSFWRSSRIKTE